MASSFTLFSVCKIGLEHLLAATVLPYMSPRNSIKRELSFKGKCGGQSPCSLCRPRASFRTRFGRHISRHPAHPQALHPEPAPESSNGFHLRTPVCEDCRSPASPITLHSPRGTSAVSGQPLDFTLAPPCAWNAKSITGLSSMSSSQ